MGLFGHTGKGNLHFVIQRHKASHLHYDLRLEIGGALKSWALRKGPSMNPDDRRLAILTQDHPLLYRFYRGIVPGPIWYGRRLARIGWRMVEIWDRGTYEPYPVPPGSNADQLMQESFKQGVVKISMHGSKLKGHFLLLKINFKGDSFYNFDKTWLLIKQDDQYAVHGAYNSEDYVPAGSLINRALEREKLKTKRNPEKL